MDFGSITSCNAIFTTIIKTISLNCSTCWLVFKKNCVDLERLHPEIDTDFGRRLKLLFGHEITGSTNSKPFLLVSMSFSMLSMVSNSSVLLKTTVKKQTNMMTVADSEQTHSTYSMNSLATNRMYMEWKAMHNPNIEKTMNTLSFHIVSLRANCGNMPNDA